MKLYFKFFGIHLRSQMQYKVSFALALLGQLLISFSVFLGIYFMFTRFSNVRGFSYNQVLLCFSVVLLAFTSAEFFFRGFDTFPGIISNGTFDRIMVRPRNAVFQVICARMDFSRLGRMIQAIAVFVYAVPNCGVAWNPARAATLVFMLIGGAAMFCGLFIIYASICFFTLEGLEFMNIFTDGSREFGTYPISIYGDSILKFFTFIVPLACFQYYPFLYLTGASDNPLFALLPAVSLAFTIPCYLFWRVGVKHFASTGS